MPRNKNPSPPPEGSRIIKTGFLYGKPAIYESHNAISFHLLSVYQSVAIRNKVFFILTQAYESFNF